MLPHPCYAGPTLYTGPTGVGTGQLAPGPRLARRPKRGLVEHAGMPGLRAREAFPHPLGLPAPMPSEEVPQGRRSPHSLEVIVSLRLAPRHHRAPMKNTNRLRRPAGPSCHRRRLTTTAPSALTCKTSCRDCDPLGRGGPPIREVLGDVDQDTPIRRKQESMAVTYISFHQ